jgi:hypothetical protein
MTTNIKLHLLLLVLLNASVLGHAQGTAFNYQGRLVENGVAANGTYDFVFTLYDAEVGGNVLGAAVTLGAVSVGAGQFFAPLDFGAGVFTGEPRWLQIAVRAAGAANYSSLTPRQALLPTPYSIYAASAGGVASGTVTANQLNTGGIAPASGQFLSYTAGNLVWSDPGVAAGNIWSLNGLNAYYNSGNVGIGTSTPAPGISLEVDGPTRLAPGGSGGFLQVGTPNGETGLGVIGANRFDLRFDGATLKLAAGPGTGPPPAEYGLTINTNGNIGIGMASPLIASQWKFEVNGPTRITGGGSGGTVELSAPNGESGLGILGANRADFRFNGSTLKIVAGVGSGPPPAENGIAISTDGNVGIGNANLDPNIKLEVRSANGFAVFGRSGFEGVHGESTHASAAAVAGFNLSTGPGVYGVSQGGGYGGFFVGRVRVGVLEIAGGADLAEPFPIKEEQIEKGSVVVIDDEHPGQLKRSTHAYDTRVAGVISGANGIHPGISLKQEDALDHGDNVALTGRVYVRADAGGGAIRPGDLLTTSNTPGHAMKVSDFTKSQGAILGKAMSGLKDGQGMVLVLVTLQ